MLMYCHNSCQTHWWHARVISGKSFQLSDIEYINIELSAFPENLHTGLTGQKKRMSECM